MHLSRTILSLLLATATTITDAKRYSKVNDAVLLSKVRSLTVRQGKQTTGRRSESVPQLTCIGGNAKGLFEVDVMQCKNSGSEYDPEDVQWTCHSSLPPEFKLGSTEVICEGYDSPDDQHVLKGSCGVEYRLVLTEMGEEKYPSNWWGGRSKKAAESFDGVPPLREKTPWAEFFFKILFWVVFIAVLLIILNKIFGGGGGAGGNGGFPNPPRNFWGGGGGGDDDDPPPPYSPRQPPRAKSGSSYSGSSRNTNSGPGFWSGTGLGGAAGYAAGNYMGARSERARQQQQRNNYAAPGPSTYNRGGGSSWFGGGGAGPSTYGGPSSSGPSAPSSSRYESTGFGGTRRR